MILLNLDLLFNQPEVFFTVIPTAFLLLLPMLVFHEVSHGWVAYMLGDDTAKRLGRLSLNPLSHLDRVGTIMLLLIGFGWAKPVPVNAYRLGMEPRKGMAIVGAAGPLTNFALAAIFSLLFRFEIIELPPSLSVASLSEFVSLVVFLIVEINVVLGILNMIPVPPLDGFRITTGILPREWAIPFARSEQYAQPIILFLALFILLTGLFSGIVATVINIFVGTDFLS